MSHPKFAIKGLSISLTLAHPAVYDLTARVALFAGNVNEYYVSMIKVVELRSRVLMQQIHNSDKTSTHPQLTNRVTRLADAVGDFLLYNCCVIRNYGEINMTLNEIIGSFPSFADDILNNTRIRFALEVCALSHVYVIHDILRSILQWNQ